MAYSYIKTDGTRGYTEDQSNAPGIDPNSGFQTSTTPPPTVGQVYKTANIASSDTQTDNAYENARKNYESNANQTVDEGSIYSNQLRQFQSEIDATNKIYAQKLADQKQVGLGNLGSSRSIQARSGLLGSDFGASQTSGVQSQNTAQEDLVRQENSQKVLEILGKARKGAADEVAAKRAAKEAGLKDYLDFLGKASERKATKSTALAQQFIDQGIDPKDIDPAELNNIAKEHGFSTAEVISSYKRTAKAMQASDIKAQPATAQEYEYAKLNGYKGSFTDYQNEDANRKKLATGTGGFTPYQTFTATQSIAKDNQNRTANLREMLRQSKLIESSYNNIINGGDRSLNTQAIITSFNKILDPTSVVRESEYDRTAQGQSLIDQLRGKVDNIASGGAGVTEQTLKEAADIAKLYLANSQKSIDAENQRARQMAQQFGLNEDFVTSVQTYSDDGSSAPVQTAIGTLDLSTWGN